MERKHLHGMYYRAPAFWVIFWVEAVAKHSVVVVNGYLSMDATLVHSVPAPLKAADTIQK